MPESLDDFFEEAARQQREESEREDADKAYQDRKAIRQANIASLDIFEAIEDSEEESEEETGE